nr:SusC/RagA family TonB-linked outer membrane protein [Xylanibacter muris]
MEYINIINIKTISRKTGRLHRLFFMTLMLMLCSSVFAQISSVHGTLSDEMGPLMGATVCEVDVNGRIINSAITDLNGNFTMSVKNQKNKIRFSYVGLKTQTMPISRSVYNIRMQSATKLKEVTVVSKKRTGGNNLGVPEREISYASQSINMKEFEGLSFTSIDEALQGRIAGLDIIGNSGDLGSGSSIRLRGASSLSTLTDSNPLIVIDGNIRSVDLTGYDLASASNETFSELLNINPEDISDIKVLKDAAATAVYGSQGGNGVIEITTKRGAMGAPRVSYSFKLTATQQPKGYKLLSGDDYTMMLKESYFNPTQNDNISQSIREINYDPTFSEYEQYNNNTDWRDAVTQTGWRQNHYLSITGGGEKARFRIGGGFDTEKGSVIKQGLDRFSTRVALDYYVSDRITVSTNFALTYTKTKFNSDDLLAIAMKKMPNMSIYEQDPVTGEDTGRFYEMLQSASSVFDKNQKDLVNPVASAYLAKKTRRTYDLVPELVINYRLLGTDDQHTRLDWRGSVLMSVYNQYDDSFYPSELRTVSWDNGVNTASSASLKSVNFNTKQTITFIPHFNNEDHSLMMMGRFELNSGTKSSQSNGAKLLPSGGIESPDAGGFNTGLASSYSQSRTMYFTYSAHYAYKGKYMADFSIRADGTTKFGPGKRWGYFPAVSLRWNISDEAFMKPTKKWLSMLSLRPSWGRVGTAPKIDYLYTSKYASGSNYLDMPTMRPSNIRLTDLRWQETSSYNIGVDLGLWDDRLSMAIETYRSTTSNLLLENYRIPSNSGFMTLPYHNSGKMRNIGWEFHINTNRLVKVGKVTIDMNANFGNNRNEILEMDEYVLNSLNSTFAYNNGEWLRRVQLHNPQGAIYGFKYKGVYQYNYETFKNLDEEGRAAFLASGKTAPVAFNANGQLILDSEGNPLRMRYNYNNEGTGKNYPFTGGDAIYEDINHDGNIDALDIVYLGSSLPKLVGGFGFAFSYKKWRLTTQFTYRVGNKILNMARLNAEAMIGNNNQSQAVNYRWRKEGDVTPIPRAMFGETSNYNTLVSDRFVESGSYLRASYFQLSYALEKKQLKSLGLNRISLYASANNPFVITKYTGVDPDISAWGYDPAIDNAQTPRTRSYTFGITVDF